MTYPYFKCRKMKECIQRVEDIVQRQMESAVEKIDDSFVMFIFGYIMKHLWILKIYNK